MARSSSTAFAAAHLTCASFDSVQEKGGGQSFFFFFGLQGVRAGGVSAASYCTPFFLFHLGGRRKRKRNQEVAERRRRVVKRSPECRVVAIRSRWKINWKGFIFYFYRLFFHFFLTFPLCLLLLLPHHMIAAHTKGPPFS